LIYIVDMPRLARLDAPGVLHHIMIRGIERRKIFRNDGDRKDFLNRLSFLIPETQTSCYAWSLMDNHAHFLFRSGGSGISHLMRRLLTGYAVSFNRRYRRHGQLFQNRYKSIICQEDTYLKELVRYIHLNPLRAKIVSNITELNKYPFCGHSVMMGRKKHDWQNSKYVLSYFDRTMKGARVRYLEYVKNGIKDGRRPELVGGGFIRSLGGWKEIRKNPLRKGERIKGDERILGDSDFVIQVLSGAEENFERRYEFKRLGYDFESILVKVLGMYDLEREDLFSGIRRKPIPDARALVCYWGVSELGLTKVYIGQQLGMTPQAVGYAADRGKIITENNDIKLME
jgi:putative transposase